MHDSARVCSLLARPISGIVPRLPQGPRSNPSLVTDPCVRPPTRFTTYQSRFTTHAFLIAGEKILKTDLTPSVPIPNAFLIAGVCPTFSPAAAPRISNRYTKLLEIELTRSQQRRKHFLIGTICPTFFARAVLRPALTTHHCLTSFLFATNKANKTIILMRAPMKTKEKQFSIRYKFALRGAGLPAEGGQSCLCCVGPGLGCCHRHRASRITNHYSLQD